ncbi:MAG: lytic murein transglycosylase [Syntrophotaleaceae bacterium]
MHLFFRRFFPLITLPLAIACCVPQPEVASPDPVRLQQPDASTTNPASADFDRWVEELAIEARSRGISETTLADALTGLQPIPLAVKAAGKQAEDVFSARRYLERMVSENRIRQGILQIREKEALFERVHDTYGVQPAYLAALWAIESDFGKGKARFPLVGALATQAWQGQRREFFRRELLAALEILDREGMKSADLRGSWAGASGQFQFIPTSYLHYAVDFDGDGHRDIWTDPADALASAANFLKEARWRPDQEWGREIQLPARFDPALAGLKVRKPLAEWRKQGLAEAAGPADRMASLLLPDGPEGPAFLVFDNFRVLMRWNRSSSFALAVGTLADRIEMGVRSEG